MTDLPTSRADCEALDRDDPLARARDLFALDDGLTYLDGHSLGPPPRTALERLERAAREEWSKGLIRSWNDAGWIDLATDVGNRIASLIGAKADEVMVTDSVSTNLYKLAAAVLPIVPERTVIVEEDEFPTDQYIAEGLGHLSGAEFVRAPAGRGVELATDRGGVLIKSVVSYRTAAVTDIAAAEAAVADQGGAIVWDLSHTTGTIAVDMSVARYAAGCTYKYLNGGPGSPAFVYVRSDVSGDVQSPLPGWMGHANPFTFSSAYEPAPGVVRFANGTPPILSLSSLAGALKAFDGIDMTTLEAKTAALGDLCLARAAAMDLPTSSPGIGSRRGGHVTLLHKEGYAIVQALIARNIIGDFRAPDAMRFGFSPLYVRYTDVWDLMCALKEVVSTKVWNRAEFQRKAKVT